MKYLLSDNYDAILEIFRVIANLSRQKVIRNYLVSRKGLFAVSAYTQVGARQVFFCFDKLT
jgi:hypothetical protein